MTDKSDPRTTGGVMITTLPNAAGGGPAPAHGPDSNILPVGTRLGEFELTNVIGEGGFGIVYLARDHSLGRSVAVKEYMPSTIAGRAGGMQVVVKSQRHSETFDAGLRSFMNEARLLARFDHPNLVKVYRFWEANGTAYMVMPFYDGQTLKQRLRELGGPPDEAWLQRVLMPILDVLDLMHSEQCYHRDIAPDNIMIMPGDRSLLLDFGAARQVIGEGTQQLTVILKPGYAPVEQYAEIADMRQGAWTDVYALAAVWYHAITGKVPPTSVARLMNDKMPPLSELGRDRFNPTLLASLDQALRVRPEERFQSIAEFRAAILAGQDDLTVPYTAQELASPRSKSPIAAPGPVAAPSTSPSQPAPDTRSRSRDDLTVPFGRGTITAPLKTLPPLTPQTVSRPSIAAAASKKRSGVAPWGALAAALIALAGALYWWLDRAPEPTPQATAPETTKPAPTPPPVAAKPAPEPPPVVAKPPVEPPPVAAKPPAPPLTPAGVIDELYAARDPSWSVASRAEPQRLRIGRDRLRLTITSPKPGYAYVIALGTDGKQLAMLFPNGADRNNQISANRPIELPRPGWAVAASGPPGTNRFVVIVADVPLDWTASGLGTQQPFAEFDFKRLEAGFAANRGEGLIGRAQCKTDQPATTKCGVFGAATFQVEEFE